MAVNEIYGIYDEASECFVQFMPSLNERVARMTIEKMFHEKRLSLPLLYDYPQTFKVLKLGTFDDNKGLFTNDPHQELLLDFGSLVVSNPSSV